MPKRSLTIKPTYCADWGVKEALREIFQNAIDTGTPVRMKKDGLMYEIMDDGDGMALSDFLLGESSKQSNEQLIGQFGEGIKIASLVFARLNRHISIRTQDKRFFFNIEHDADWGDDLLTMHIDNADFTLGTIVKVECSEAEMKESASLFRALPDKYKDVPSPKVRLKLKNTDLLEAPRQIFVNGQKVTEANTIFGYDFVGQKDLVNRDRNAINNQAVINAVVESLKFLKHKPTIKEIMLKAVSKDHNNEIEIAEKIYIQDGKPWKEVITSMFGTARVCVACGAHSDVVASSKNWIVLQLPYGIQQSLRWADVLKTSSDVLEGMKDKEWLAIKRLPFEQRELLEKAREVYEYAATMLGLDVCPVKIYYDLNKDRGYFINSGTVIHHEDGKHEIGLEIGGLEDGILVNVVRTLLHEATHITKGVEDFTIGFENALAEQTAMLAVVLHGIKK